MITYWNTECIEKIANAYKNNKIEREKLKISDCTEKMVKQELHELIDGLNVEKSLNDENCNILPEKICTLHYVTILLKLRQKLKKKH